jgi:signal transduction histidine kinase
MGQGVTTELDVSGVDETISQSVVALIYRAAQEGLRNARNHARATKVMVRVSVEGDRAILVVQDDGQGFDVETANAQAAAGHVGLKGIAGLASDAGGTLRVRSEVGAGTNFRLEVPLS